MIDPTDRPFSRASRREILALSAAMFSGCAAPLFRGQSPDPEPVAPKEDNARRTLFVGELAGAYGLQTQQLKGVALVTGLEATGSDPAPSSVRNYLIGEMKSRQISKPEEILKDPNNSLAIVIAHMPAACKKGDPIDVEVQISPKSKTTSLRGGWVMLTRMRPMINFDGQTHTGHIAGLAQGNIVVDSIFNGKSDLISETRGRILGGGVCGQDRELGLAVRQDDSSVVATTSIAAAINERFHAYSNGSKRGSAEPVNDRRVKLLVPTRYRHNIQRFVFVCRSLAIRESPGDKQARLATLERKLLEPTTSASAALQLEGIGSDGISVLEKGLQSPNEEVRFYSAEALAYLDQPIASKELGLAAMNESAFRWYALTALTVLDHVDGYESLTRLLSAKSVETRYGAFRAMRKRNPGDPLIQGETLGEQCFLHTVPIGAEPLVHFTRSQRPEITVFGSNVTLNRPKGVSAGAHIVVNSSDDGKIRVSHFFPGKSHAQLGCDSDVPSVARTIVEAGGTYGDIIQAIAECKRRGFLDARVSVEALPKPLRTYVREDGEPESNAEETKDADSKLVKNSSRHGAMGPVPAMFADPLDGKPSVAQASATQDNETFIDEKYSGAKKKSGWWSWFGR